MPRYPLLPTHILEKLKEIEPSQDRSLAYFPCSVTLKTGEVLDAVYIASEKPYMRIWGIYPEDDRGKRSIRVEDVTDVRESLMRLPASFANDLYREGESGMGYTIFTVVFSDGGRQACVTGGAVDFIQYPPHKGSQNVIGVIPHEGRTAPSLVKGPDYYWCLYSEQEG